MLSGPDVPTMYLSGDNASIGAVKAIGERADVHGSAGSRGRRPTGGQGVIPAHVDGWAHFSEGLDEFVGAFDEAGLGHLVAVAPYGHWITFDANGLRDETR